MKGLTITTPRLLAASAAISVAAFAPGAFAGDSSPSEFRGYQACVEANADNLTGLAMERHYLLNETADGRIYYINATAWEDGERVNVGLSCETTPGGRLTSNEGVTYNRFVQAAEGRVQVEVAGN